jgi:dTMP kinase
MLIVMEGADYVGKSTQRELLAARLEAEGYEVLRTREVGGTPYAERIRDLMFNRPDDCESVSPLAELLLAYAARTQHLEQVVLPALNAGKIVITDRFVQSTFCYQVWPYIEGNMQHGLLNVFMGLNGSVLGGVITEEPLVFILSINDETRALRHAANDKPDAIEKRGPEFMAKVVDAYAQHAGSPNHEMIDANRPAAEIAEELYKHFVAYQGATTEMRLMIADQQAQAAAGQRPAPDAMDELPPELRALAAQIQRQGVTEMPDHSYATAQANGFPGTEADWVAHLSNMQQVELSQAASAQPQGTLADNARAMATLVQRYDADPSQLTEVERTSVEQLRARAKAAMDDITANGEALAAQLEAGVGAPLEILDENAEADKPAEHVYTQ